jgi:hypothetical protein
MEYRIIWEAGFRVFGLYGRDKDGKCECGNPACPEKSLFKHPRVSNWQHTPHWSEEQLDTMVEMGQFATGYGIACRELLVVDVDARNGGVASLQKLLGVIPEVAGSGMIVNTGSGNGSKHYYFRVPEGVALVGKLIEYPGLDFKSGAAFVVGPGSQHASGTKYEIAYGSPEDIDMVPDTLLNLLRVPERHRADLGGRTVDVADAELAEMLSHVPNTDLDYDEWIKIGMALHHATGGAGFDLWDRWSQQSTKYDDTSMEYKWHSFGKSANPVTLGTLVHYAERNGYIQPVTFTPDKEFTFETPEEYLAPKAIDISSFDPLRPPGFAGKLATWIESRTRRKREALAAMSAIWAMGVAFGLHYRDDRDRATTNLFVFNVAGSGSGKDGILSATAEVLEACGLSAAVHGTIKSEQEIARNLTRHQMAAYMMDEVGFLFQKISGAKKSGASYLEGVVGLLMSAYSKADGRLMVSGDLKEDIRGHLLKELTQVEKAMDEHGEKPNFLARQKAIIYQLDTLDAGIDRPFLAMTGYTTEKNFNELVNFESATTGFIGRAILCIEQDTTPATKKGWKKTPMPEALKLTIQQLSSGGTYDVMDGHNRRVEHYGERIEIPTSSEAADMLDNIVDLFDQMAYEHKESTGLEALPLRGYEQVSKISLILAVPEGVRTVEHVRWAYALVRRDIQSKMRLVLANDNEKVDPEKALVMTLLQMVDGPDGETAGVIMRRLERKYKRPDIEEALTLLVNGKKISMETSEHKYNKRKTVRYKLIHLA